MRWCGIDGCQWLIDPPISIPSDWERIGLLPDGRVQTFASGSWTNTGQIQLAVFDSTPTFDDPMAANLGSVSIGAPVHLLRGDGAGVIQQHWVERRPKTLPGLVIRILVAILTASVLRGFSFNAGRVSQLAVDSDRLAHGTQ